jgi:hypothetical protein
MNQPDFQRKFYKAAARLPEQDRVPYAFEKRIMANLDAMVTDVRAVWGRFLWRAVAPCLGVMLVTTILTSVTGETESFAPDLESAVLAPIATEYDNW